MGKRKLGIAAAALAAVLLAAGLLLADRVRRVMVVGSLFTGAEQHQNFNRMDALFPVAELPPAPRPAPLPAGEPLELPATFAYQGRQLDTADFLARTDTSALLVLHEGKVRYERYWLTGGPQVPWLSMSVAKSFVSALVGIAVAEGAIGGIEEAVTDYLPQLAGSAYDGVRIKDVLQMSSGAAWNEDYADPDSDINRFGRIFAMGGSMNEFAATLRRELPPGTYNRYNSTDTQVLGMLLVAATGRPIADYMAEKLWHPMGARDRAYWLRDSEGMEMAFAGFNATAHDYAKLGELYRLGGALNGRQIVPAGWVRASVTPDAPHLMPGDNPASDWPMGYGYQWWVPEGDQGEFSAIGVYNQFVYVAPQAGMVVVKLSANRAYGTPADPNGESEFQTIELFRAIARAR